MTRHALLKEVLNLSAGDHADVAAELIASLDNEPVGSSEEVEKAWAAEIARRARRVLAGGSAGLRWDDVRDRLEARLAKG